MYCRECGTQNDDNARYCRACGASLEIPWEKSFEQRAEEWGKEFGRRAEEWGEQLNRRVDEEECFGLPHGGPLISLIFGLFLILLGISWVAGLQWEFLGPLAVIVFGILIIAGALYGARRRAR